MPVAQLFVEAFHGGLLNLCTTTGHCHTGRVSEQVQRTHEHQPEHQYKRHGTHKMNHTELFDRCTCRVGPTVFDKEFSSVDIIKTHVVADI